MLNIVVLTGRLTADPEIKFTKQTSVAVTSFPLAVQRKYSGGQEKVTDFINIVAWRNTAEFICKHFKKGQMIAVEGSIQTRSYQDNDGNNRKAFEVVANGVDFVGSKADNESSGGADQGTTLSGVHAPKQKPFTDYSNYGNEDLPF